MNPRIKEAETLLAALPPLVAQSVHADLLSAEAKLTDAMDQLDASGTGRAADVLQFVRDDVRALRRAANDARLK